MKKGENILVDKKRLVFLDVLRAAAFLLVFFYHFLVRIAENGIAAQETVQKIYEHPNYHIATLGVSLFFMISGAGLMLSSNHKWNTKEYFQKRAMRILLPFYIAYAGIFAAMYVMKGGQVFEEGIPNWHFIFTIAGVDGYLKEFGISTFSLGVGEWFLGCLIIMYVCFPLLRKWMFGSGEKCRKIFMAVATLVYILLVLKDTSGLPVHMNFGVKLYEFILGMYFAGQLNDTEKVQREKKKKSETVYDRNEIDAEAKLVKVSRDVERWLIAASILVLLTAFLCPVLLPIKEGFKITIVTLAVIFLMSQPEFLFEKRKTLIVVLKWFGTYSFEMYLIHHWIIIVITGFAAKWINGIGSLVLLFVVEMMVTLLGAVIVKRIADLFLVCYNKNL